MNYHHFRELVDVQKERLWLKRAQRGGAPKQSSPKLFHEKGYHFGGKEAILTKNERMHANKLKELDQNRN